MLAYRFLALAGAKPQLTCGVRREEGELVGHAWIVVDGRPLADPRERVDEFTPIASFGARGARLQAVAERRES